MGKVKMICEWCGKEFYRYRSSAVGKHVFCCADCSHKFKTKKLNPDGYTKHPHLSKYNEDHNADRMTESVKAKLSAAKYGSGESQCYLKLHGRHEHRQVMEQKLGRPLLPGEVVHHIDGDPHNNAPENLMLFSSQAEHARFHMNMRYHKKRGDAV